MAAAYLSALAIMFIGMATICCAWPMARRPDCLVGDRLPTCPTGEEKGTAPICAKHPEGRSGGHRPKVGRGLSPFPPHEPLWSIAPVTALGLRRFDVGSLRAAANSLTCCTRRSPHWEPTDGES